jgi:hypothetical protein
METTLVSEADIFAQVVLPPGSSMSRDQAESILQWKFSPQAHEQMRELLQKNNDGTILAEEREILDRFRRVGQTINILQAQARLVLSDRVLSDNAARP